MRCFAARRRHALTVLGTAATLGALALVLAGRWGQFAHAAAGASWWLLGAAVALHLACLLTRSEAWSICVGAAGAVVDRRRVYGAASIGYVGNLINGELGFAMRILALRRAAPEHVPKAVTLAATELPIIIVEVTLATLTCFTLVGPLGLAWWTPIVAFAVMLGVTVLLAHLARRRTRGWRRGLAVLGDGSARARMAALVLFGILAQIARNWLMLRAVGIHASVFEATAVLIAVSVLSTLPVGPSAAAAAAVLILGAHGVAGVSAAGVLLTVTGAAGALAYAAWALADRRWIRRTNAPELVPRPSRAVVSSS